MSHLKPEVKLGSIFKGGDLWITDGIDIWILFGMEFNQDCSEAHIMSGGVLRRWNISASLVDQVILAGEMALARGAF